MDRPRFERLCRPSGACRVLARRRRGSGDRAGDRVAAAHRARRASTRSMRPVCASGRWTCLAGESGGGDCQESFLRAVAAWPINASRWGGNAARRSGAGRLVAGAAGTVGSDRECHRRRASGCASSWSRRRPRFVPPRPDWPARFRSVSHLAPAIVGGQRRRRTAADSRQSANAGRAWFRAGRWRLLPAAPIFSPVRGAAGWSWPERWSPPTIRWWRG